MEQAVLLDTTVGIYSLGDDSPQRAANRAFLTRVASGELNAYASVEMVQELVHHRLRRTGDRSIAVANGRDIGTLCTLLTFDREVLDLSLDLIERLPHIRGRDAVHVATALAYGLDTIVSSDRAFDGIPGVTRLDPVDVT